MDERSNSLPKFLTQPQWSDEGHSVSLHVVDETPLHAEVAFNDFALGLYISGRHRIRRKIGGRSVEGWSDPGAINFTPPNIDGIWDADGPSRAVVLLIPELFVARVIAENWGADARQVELIKQFLIRDPVIEAVTMNLAREVKSGSLGQLYADSAYEFLTHHLIHNYSSLSAAAPQSSGGLPTRRLNLVLDYIQESLGQPIALSKLANLAGVSVRHFERAFRQSVGKPAHAYVLEKRIAAARDLLVSKLGFEIAEIARRVGFSSASHLSSAFRRQTGCTPTTFRKLYSR
jgi:AraC family transcriptional regulator